MPEPSVRDERIDPGDVLRGRLMRRDLQRGEVPIPALGKPRAERTRDSRFRKPAVTARDR
ncbi:hypothetical protein GCM10007198_06020 [Microbacterium aerolatum]|uniref:Uncharacterized protein n=1 Tax=Microbacterium aerolatum TaxID=153731 RepID=A0A511AEM1_9MICO|nr:hypothetical protein MAE01_17840 [Microbacterium aerolatum]GGB18271.1 hypothetical protein GCM10007198_06020 [Microbacterium aerolatum]